MKNHTSKIYRFSVSAIILSGIMLSLTFSNWSIRAEIAFNENAVEKFNQKGENDSLASAIQTARYSVEKHEDKFYAANPANKMKAVFDDAGKFSVESARADMPWQIDWKLKSIGRDFAQQPIRSGEWLSDETKISARHSVELFDDSGEILVEERFENRPDGLEQVFVVEEKPQIEAQKPQSDLRLVLQTSGDLIAEASSDGQIVSLTNRSGEKILRYEKLKVWDANLHELAAKMRTEKSGEIWLEVEDKDAVYPITIDPSFVQQYKLTRPDSTTGDNFGEAFAYSSSDTQYLAIGAPNADVGGNVDQGAVYIFQKTSSVWIFMQKITASDGAAGDNFGSSLCTGFGRDFWIGAPNDNIGINSDQGSAYKFELSGTTGVWTESLKVLATDGAAEDNFGSKIFYTNSTSIFISAPNDDVGKNANQGSVYWINQETGGHRRRLNAADGQANDNFGSSISAIYNSDSGDIQLFSGAPRDDNGSNTDQGSVYILNYDYNTNTWIQAQKLLAQNGALGDNFGSSLLIESAPYSGDLYVGASSDDIGSNSGEGSVSFYRNNNGVFSFQRLITASDGAAFDRFGTSLSYYGFFDSTLVIGSPFADIGGNNNQGAIYFFNKSVVNNNATFRQTSKRTAPDGAANDHFGSQVTLVFERDLLVSSPDDDVNANTDQGSVSVMRRVAEFTDFDHDFEADISIYRPSNGQWWYEQSNGLSVKAFQFGTSSDRIMPGDFTGDGKTDIAIWRPASGEWFVLRSENNSFYSFPFGTSTDLPTVGDFDGDAKSDAAVFRPSTATWYINKSSGGTTIQTFGLNGDVPVVKDYDDDGKSDIAIFRPSNGQWWIQRSFLGTIAYTFGNGADKPVPADYTGDGKTDVAVFRPSSGEWYVLRSEDASYYSVPFGISTDIPAPADYDGDGIADVAIFRPSETNWYINKSRRGILIKQFGSNGDRPVPNAFVP